MVNFLINLYKKYGLLFQGKIFSAVILFYKESRIPGISHVKTLIGVLKRLSKIKVYGGDKSSQIRKISANSENVDSFILCRK